MKPMTRAAEDLLSAVQTKAPDPILVGAAQTPGGVYTVSTARQLEKRGLVQVGLTDRKDGEVRLYEVSLTSAGRAYRRCL